MVLLELFLQMGIVELPNSVRCTWDGEVGIAEKVHLYPHMQLP